MRDNKDPKFWADVYDQRRLDLISHFILRLAFCRRLTHFDIYFEVKMIFLYSLLLAAGAFSFSILEMVIFGRSYCSDVTGGLLSDSFPKIKIFLSEGLDKNGK